jgi:hypothetical protein
MLAELVTALKNAATQTKNQNVIAALNWSERIVAARHGASAADWHEFDSNPIDAEARTAKRADVAADTARAEPLGVEADPWKLELRCPTHGWVKPGQVPCGGKTDFICHECLAILGRAPLRPCGPKGEALTPHPSADET